MLAAASLLTIATLGGLVAGFAREWLLVASWGASARTDAFVIAMFLPEAVRTMLAAGVFTSSALSLWQARDAAARRRWFAQINFILLIGSVLLAALGSFGAGLLVQVLAPGLSPTDRQQAAQALAVLAWSLPAIVLQAWWAVPRHAAGRFLLAAMASLAYNLPALLYLAWRRSEAEVVPLSWAFVAGSVIAALLLLPSAWRAGMADVRLQGLALAWREWMGRLTPLLGSALAGQGLTLLERIVASYLGEGVVTAVNLARKLMNLPLIALQSLNQVLLSLMSRQQRERVRLLRGGLAAVTLVSLPASLGLVLATPAVMHLLFPKVHGVDLIVPLLGGYAAILVLAGWNTLLARYHYAEGDTRGPLMAELGGSLIQALAMPLLAWWWGPVGLVAALMAGTLLTGQLLLREPALQAGLGLRAQGLVCAAVLACAWWWGRPLMPLDTWPMLGVASALSVLSLVLLAAWLRPWRRAA